MKKTKRKTKQPGKAARQRRYKGRARSRSKSHKPAPRYNPRLEQGLKEMRKGVSVALAARKIGVTPGVLRRYVVGTGTVQFRDGKRIFKRDRRFRRMPIYSDGRREIVTVHNSKTARLIGKYMSAVRQFFETENIELLAPFRGQSIPDISGKRYVFETRPNVLFRLDASGVEPFELVYSIMKPE